MTRPQKHGFTLIELLVVIAIIAILAAMLFPVFARARESARKIQCLANVKNIATAFQMYLTDYDRFPPSEHRTEVIAAFNDGTLGACGCGGGRQCCAQRVAAANPYLQVPVILDEYVKNRDVWKCPSARNEGTFQILNPYLNSRGTDDWFLAFKEMQSLCPRPRSCDNPFPPGWGGAVTDSRQGGVWCTATGPGAFTMSIGVANNLDVKTSQVTDAAKWVVCGDAGMNWVINFEDTLAVAYADYCRMRSVGCGDWCGHCGYIADEGCCTTPLETGCAPARGEWQVAVDPEYRKDHFPPRHLGGSNLGFADGHAVWMSSEAILFDGENLSGYGHGPNLIENLNCCFVAEKLY